MRKLIFLSILLFNFCLADSLVITEIMYNPEGNDSGREWLEAINTSNQTLNLTSGKKGWRIDDGKSHLFEENLTIYPNEIFVIIQDRNKFLQDYPNFKGKTVLANFSLKNEAGTIKILNENKEILAQASYQNSYGADGNGYTLVFDGEKFIEGKIKGGTPGEENFEDHHNLEVMSTNTSTLNEEIKTNSTTIDTTKIQENSIEQRQTSSNQIEENETKTEIPNILAGKLESIRKEILWQNLFLNEFLPNPENKDSENEFIEIWNANQEKVNLDGLILIVGQKEIPLSGEIDGRSFLVLARKDYRFIIKNSGDQISLQTIHGKLIHRISFAEPAPEGFSFARFSNGWQWTLPTPGKENQLVELIKENQTDLTNLIFENKTENNGKNQLNVQELVAKTENTNQSRRNYLFEFILPLISLVMVASFIFWKYLL